MNLFKTESKLDSLLELSIDELNNPQDWETFKDATGVESYEARKKLEQVFQGIYSQYQPLIKELSVKFSYPQKLAEVKLLIMRPDRHQKTGFSDYEVLHYRITADVISLPPDKVQAYGGFYAVKEMNGTGTQVDHSSHADLSDAESKYSSIILLKPQIQ